MDTDSDTDSDTEPRRCSKPQCRKKLPEVQEGQRTYKKCQTCRNSDLRSKIKKRNQLKEVKDMDSNMHSKIKKRKREKENDVPPAKQARGSQDSPIDLCTPPASPSKETVTGDSVDSCCEEDGIETLFNMPKQVRGLSLRDELD